jgi:hypothetical protein
MAKKVAAKKATAKKTAKTCSVAGSQLATKGVGKKTKVKAGSTLGKYC